MNKNQRTFSDLQEIIFWQQLNKQLIELRNAGRTVRDEHQKYIQLFSLNNLLFSKITGATLYDDIPMGLITDLSKICFINLKLNPWNECLTQLIPDSFVLDIEQALTDSFETHEKYDKKYYPDEKKDEDDEQLYGFIEEYLAEREKQGRDIADIVQKIYGLKGASIQWIMQSIDYNRFVIIEENHLFFDFSSSDKNESVLENYLDKFCQKAVSIIDPIIFPLKEMDLYGLLLSKETQRNLKPSIREFVDHEIKIFQEETDLLKSFASRVQGRINARNLYKIDICDLSPLSFLNSPFPSV